MLPGIYICTMTEKTLQNQRQPISDILQQSIRYNPMSQISLKNKPQNYIAHLQKFKNTAAMMRQMFGPGSKTFTYADTSSKPTTASKPLSNLQLISIDEMELEKVHYGRYIRLRFMCDCFKQNAIIGLCQDHTQKKCIEISIINFELKGKHFDHYFRQNTVIYLKQPYYKTARTGTKIIRVDNSIDIIFEKEALKMLNPSNNIQTSVEAAKELQSDRIRGVQLMKSNEYVDAYILYDSILKKDIKSEDRIKFTLNKAIVCSKLNLKKQYVQNIESVLKINPKHHKAVYHKFKSLVLLQQYQQAESYAGKNLDAINEQTLCELKHFKEYNLRTTQNRVDWFRAFKDQELGEYFSPKITIGKSPFGLGVIAKSQIRRGQILIVEQPLLSTGYIYAFKCSQDPSGFVLKKKMEDLYKHSQQFRQKCKILSTPRRIQEQQSSPRKDLKIESYLEVEEVVNANSFGLFDLESAFYLQKENPRKGAALYEKISMLNHSCEANCTRINIGNTMVVSAVEDIHQNQELFISYMKSIDYMTRKQHLRLYGIDCHCLYCQSQLYQLQHGKPLPNGRSKEHNKQKISEEFVLDLASEKKKQKVFDESYEIADISGFLWLTKDRELAAKALRRVFPMSVKESARIIEMYAHK